MRLGQFLKQDDFLSLQDLNTYCHTEQHKQFYLIKSTSHLMCKYTSLPPSAFPCFKHILDVAVKQHTIQPTVLLYFTALLRDRGKVIFYLRGLQSTKSWTVADSNFNVVLRHLTFKAFLQGQDSCVHCILQLQAFTVPVTTHTYACRYAHKHTHRESDHSGSRLTMWNFSVF